jgi:hypothetical protein
VVGEKYDRVLGFIFYGGRHTPGAKAPFLGEGERPKAEALGYLEAKTSWHEKAEALGYLEAELGLR